MDIKHSSSKACCQDKYDRERGKKINKKKHCKNSPISAKSLVIWNHSLRSYSMHLASVESVYGGVQKVPIREAPRDQRAALKSAEHGGA